MFAGLKKVRNFALALRHEAQTYKQQGALVQLVRIHACHAWGHGFESRTHRKRVPRNWSSFCLLAFAKNKAQTYIIENKANKAFADFLLLLYIVSI